MSIRERNVQSYFRKGIIVDTGPLVLLLAGYYNYDSIGKSKLTAEFTKDFRFKGLCISEGLPVIHFDKLRAESWEI